MFTWESYILLDNALPCSVYEKITFVWCVQLSKWAANSIRVIVAGFLSHSYWPWCWTQQPSHRGFLINHLSKCQVVLNKSTATGTKALFGLVGRLFGWLDGWFVGWFSLKSYQTHLCLILARAMLDMNITSSVLTLQFENFTHSL